MINILLFVVITARDGELRYLVKLLKVIQVSAFHTRIIGIILLELVFQFLEEG